jgi:hypothetical protein
LAPEFQVHAMTKMTILFERPFFLAIKSKDTITKNRTRWPK